THFLSFFFLRTRPPPRSTLFPYTTLFRSESVGLMQTLVTTAQQALGAKSLNGDDLLDPTTSIRAGTAYIAQQRVSTHFDPPLVRSEEHTSELQSLTNLVCRLLLEKKKKLK